MAKQKEKFRTAHTVFDEFTNRTLFKLISEKHFDGLESPIFVGKESNVFTAKKGDLRVIVKIYRLETCDFNRMFDYIKLDVRYGNVNKKKREIIFSWVQREFRNLLKARQANVRVPIPIRFLNNVLVMEFIGNHNPTPRLKDKIPKNKKLFAEEVISNIKKLYDAKLIHADLSAFNILNHNEKPVFIDFSQSTTLDNSRAEEFLMRDIKNIVDFFNKIGLKLDINQIKKIFKGS